MRQEGFSLTSTEGGVEMVEGRKSGGLRLKQGGGSILQRQYFLQLYLPNGKMQIQEGVDGPNPLLLLVLHLLTPTRRFPMFITVHGIP